MDLILYFFIDLLLFIEIGHFFDILTRIPIILFNFIQLFTDLFLFYLKILLFIL